MTPEEVSVLAELVRDSQHKIDALHKAMIGDEYEEGFIKKFNRYCARVRKLELTVISLVCILIGMGILQSGMIIK
jgi:hypothetical protein